MTNAQYLKKQSKDICKLNKCTEEEHFCGSYAYFDKKGTLLDICYPDYFAGHSGPTAAISLPWSGSQKDLDREIREQISNMVA